MFILSLLLMLWATVAIADDAQLNEHMYAGVVAWERGDYDEAESQLDVAIREAEAIGDDRQDVASFLRNLLATLQELVTRERELGREHAEVRSILSGLSLRFGLAMDFKVRPEVPEADRVVKRYLELQEKELGSEDLHYYGTLGDIYQAQGRYAEAEQAYKRAQAFWGDEPSAFGYGPLQMRLAAFYQSQGRYTEAELHYKRALEAFGDYEESWQLAQITHDLAVNYHYQGRYEEAESLYKRSLSLSEKIFEPDDPAVAMILQSLAMLYQSRGRYTEAELLYKRALSIREKAFGHEHPHVATTLNSLAEPYRAQGRNEEAERLLREHRQ